MITNICFGLAVLLIPLLIELFNLQAGLHLSGFGHSLAEVLILFLFYWLLLQILHLDELLYWRYYWQDKNSSTPKNLNVEYIERLPLVQKTDIKKVKQTQKPIFHGLRMIFGGLFKNHRTVKPL